jgi:hypothetical protein
VIVVKKVAVAVVVMAAGVGMVYGAPGGAPGNGPGGAMQGGGRAGRGGAARVPTNLHSAMTDMGGTLKRIKAEYADAAKFEATMGDIFQMERDIAIAKGSLPDKVQALTGDAKMKAAKEYQGMLRNLLKKFIDLEEAVSDGKNDTAKSALGDIDKLMETGHKEFMNNE